MRPPTRTICWLRTTSSIILAVTVLLSPIRTPQTPTTRIYPDDLYQNFSLDFHRSGLPLTLASPKQTSVDSDYPDFEEEDEDELFWSFSHLAYFTPIPLNPTPNPLSGLLPGNSPPRTAAGPLLC